MSQPALEARRQFRIEVEHGGGGARAPLGRVGATIGDLEGVLPLSVPQFELGLDAIVHRVLEVKAEYPARGDLQFGARPEGDVLPGRQTRPVHRHAHLPSHRLARRHVPEHPGAAGGVVNIGGPVGLGQAPSDQEDQQRQGVGTEAHGKAPQSELFKAFPAGWPSGGWTSIKHVLFINFFQTKVSPPAKRAPHVPNQSRRPFPSRTFP